MEITCKACGNSNIEGAQFCQVCGKELGKELEDLSLRPGSILDNRYEIKRLIKAGGMGAVYEAFDQRFENRTCAVKEMLNISSNEEEEEYLIKRFKAEAEMLNALRHPNLPVVKDYFIENRRYYLVMDYIEGKDLKTILKSSPKKGLPESTVINWALQILDALDYIHNQSPPIIYRDLKPENVMVRNSDNKIMLVDFGIARRIDPKSQTKKTVIGTLIYSPEEMFQGNAEPRTDIYSLGATMHCLLTGKIPKNPFDFKPVREINPRITPELETIVMKALGRKPEERYKNAKEMKFHIRNLPVPTASISISESEEANITDKSYQPETISTVSKVQPPSTVPSPSIPSGKEEKKGSILKSLLIGIFGLTTIGIIIFLLITIGGIGLYYMGSGKKPVENPTPVITIPYNNQTETVYDWYNKGAKLYDKGQYEEAIECFNRAINMDSTYINAWLDKGMAQSIIEQYNEAINSFDKVIELEPENVTAWYEKGLALFYLNDYNRAIECYDRAIELSPNFVVAFTSKGEALYDQEKYEEALECYNEALAINPESTTAWFDKGLTLFKLERYEEEFECYKRVTEIEPNNVDAWYNMGCVAHDRGDYTEAIQYYNKALEIDPSYTEAKEAIEDAKESMGGR